MLQRIDDLDRENEQLREEVAELQDLKEELEERIDRTVNRCSKTEKEHREQKVSWLSIEDIYYHLVALNATMWHIVVHTI